MQASTIHSGNTLTDNTQSVHKAMKPKLIHKSDILTEVDAEGMVVTQSATESSNTGAMDVNDMEPCTKSAYSDTDECLKNQEKNGNAMCTHIRKYTK